MLKITLSLMDEGGSWRVSGPNGNYRECTDISKLSETVSQVVADYAEWLKKLTAVTATHRAVLSS